MKRWNSSLDDLLMVSVHVFLSVFDNTLILLVWTWFVPFLALFNLLETDTNSNILHGVISLLCLWTLYAILLIYSPLFHSWHGFTHQPLENLTTYTSLNYGNNELWSTVTAYVSSFHIEYSEIWHLLDVRMSLFIFLLFFLAMLGINLIG